MNFNTDTIVAAIWVFTIVLTIAQLIHWRVAWGSEMFKRKMGYSSSLLKLWFDAGLSNYSILFYGMSFWFAILGIFYHLVLSNPASAGTLYEFLFRTWYNASLILPLVVLPMLYLSRLALRLESAEEFAKRTISSHDMPAAIELASHQILDLAELFLNSSGKLGDQYTSEAYSKIFTTAYKHGSDISDLPKESGEAVANLLMRASRLEESVEGDIRDFALDSSKQFLRIESLKNEISKQLDVSPRLLCDRLFCFSPSIAKRRLNKLVNNLYLIRDWKEGDKEQTPYVVELLSQTINIFQWFEKVVADQRLILASVDTLPHLCKLLGEKSGSSAIHTYADAIRESILNMEDSAASAQDTKDKLKFLFERQFAYSKFSPHYLLQSVHSNNESVRLELQKIADLANKHGTEIEIDYEHLMNLLNITNIALYKERNKVKANLRAKIGEIEKPRDQGKVILLTSGYGRAVRTVMKSLIRDWPEGDLKSISIEDKVHYIHIDDDDHQGVGARLLKHELKNETYRNDERKSEFPSAAGDAAELMQSLKPSDRVICLVGLDAFADENLVVSKKAKILLNLLKSLPPERYDVFFLAEEYKSFGKIQSANNNALPWRDYMGQPYGSFIPGIIDLKSHMSLLNLRLKHTFDDNYAESSHEQESEAASAKEAGTNRSTLLEIDELGASANTSLGSFQLITSLSSEI